MCSTNADNNEVILLTFYCRLIDTRSRKRCRRPKGQFLSSSSPISSRSDLASSQLYNSQQRNVSRVIISLTFCGDPSRPRVYSLRETEPRLNTLLVSSSWNNRSSAFASAVRKTPKNLCQDVRAASFYRRNSANGPRLSRFSPFFAVWVLSEAVIKRTQTDRISCSAFRFSKNAGPALWQMGRPFRVHNEITCTPRH